LAFKAVPIVLVKIIQADASKLIGKSLRGVDVTQRPNTEIYTTLGSRQKKIYMSR